VFWLPKIEAVTGKTCPVGTGCDGRYVIAGFCGMVTFYPGMIFLLIFVGRARM
jgi:hypothetical protein